MHTPLCEPAVHTGTSLSVLRSPSETNGFSDCHSILVTTPSSRRILVLIHHVGKNGEHFYGENFIYEYPSKRHTKSNQHMGILHVFNKSNQHMGTLHAFSNCVREHSTMGPAPQKLTGVILKENLQKCSSTHQVETCSWKLTGRQPQSIITPQVDPCSWKLTGEANS